MRIYVKRLPVRALGIISVLFFPACSRLGAPAAAPIEAQPAAEALGARYVVHRVHYKGETLSAIAKWYTGKSANWKQIAKASPGLKHDKLGSGTLVLIPQELVIESNPMPQTALRTAVKTPKKTKPTVHLKAASQEPIVELQAGVYSFDKLPPPPGLDPEEVFVRQKLTEELLEGIE